MSSNRIAPIALLSIAGLAALAFLASAASGCQILSGISDLEATGGADAGSSTGTKSSSSSSSGMSSSGTMATTTTGSGICDPGASVAPTCAECGQELTGAEHAVPPYCNDYTMNQATCQVGCVNNDPTKPETICGTNIGTTLVDTDVMPMLVSCNGPNCDGDTIECFEHGMNSPPTGHVYPCKLECAAGSCNNTTFDCSKTYGVCEVTCHGNGCEGLKVKCGTNKCIVHCPDMPMPIPAITVEKPVMPCDEDFDPKCGVEFLPPP